MHRKTIGPTEQELEIMKIVWSRGSVTVRDVYEELLRRRKVAYTTVMTMMGILATKGQLKKTLGEKAYVYQPAKPKQEVVGGMVSDFISRLFNGSARLLVLHLVETEQVSAEEIDEFRRLLKKRENR